MTNSGFTATATLPAPSCPDRAELGPFVLTSRRWAGVKRAYTTRFAAAHIDALLAHGDTVEILAAPEHGPHPGDLVLARVTQLGQHKRLESPDSRRQTLFVGDEILVAYGHRYAPDQFEAEIPEDLGPVELVAAGGLAGRVLSRHGTISPATKLQPIGLLSDSEGRLRLDRACPRTAREVTHAHDGRPPVIAVLGTSMNSGKSTTASCLIRGLSAAGLRVNAGKVTGTGAGGDPRLFADAGAGLVLDFTDFGHGSTYRLDHASVRSLLTTMVDDLSGAGAEPGCASDPVDPVHAVVMEIADGVYQDETARLLADPLFTEVADHVIFAAGDALGAVAGHSHLRNLGIDVTAVSGVLTSAPLATREASAVLEAPVVATFDLCRPEVARGLLEL